MQIIKMYKKSTQQQHREHCGKHSVEQLLIITVVSYFFVVFGLFYAFYNFNTLTLYIGD